MTETAGQKIGVVNLDIVMANFSLHNEARKHLAEYARTKDALIVAEANAAIREQLLERGRREYTEEERRIMTPVFQAVRKAIEETAASNDISAVYNAGAILYGGTDITKEVILQLNKRVAETTVKTEA